MSGDSRKDFLLATTADYFGVGSSDANMLLLLASNELNSFLDDGNCMVLTARFEQRGVGENSEWNVRLGNRVEASDTSNQVCEAMFTFTTVFCSVCCVLLIRLSSNSLLDFGHIKLPRRQ